MIRITDEGKRRLEQVAQWILKEPDSFVMLDWAMESESAACGTVGCVAGWLAMTELAAEDDLTSAASAVQSTIKQYRNWQGVARFSVDLITENYNGSEETFPLFHVHTWPSEYKEDYKYIADSLFAEQEAMIKARKDNAKLTAKLIREVIQKGGIWWIGDD
jgi:uncharacterized protein YqkB